MVLPNKPYTPNMPPGPGPAPPLPSGPPPAYGPPQDQQANHQAAWAAYYQSQGMGGAPAYNPAGSTSQPAQPAPNPYANYGYGAGAQLSHTANQRPPGQAQSIQAGYRPPAPPPYSSSNQPQQYGPQQPYNAQAPYRPPQTTQQIQAYGGGFGQHPPAQQSYRPPAGQPAYNAQAQQAQYFQQAQPAQQGQYNAVRSQPSSAFRPAHSPSPAPPQNRPYQPAPPANRMPSGPGRPPQGGAGFPPAKRPRFDSPQAPMAGPSVPVRPGGQGMHGLPHAPMQNHTPPRPSMPVRPMGPNVGQPGFVPRPTPPPNGPSSSRASSSSLPAPPIQRPPIHLGLGGPPPSLPFGGQIRGGLGGGGSGGFRGGMAARGGRGGLMNAPRGPAGMRRPDVARNRDADKKRGRDKDRDHKEKEAKTTMSDFRIVGIEVKEIGWSWGVPGDVEDSEEAGAEADEPTVETKENSSAPENSGDPAEEKSATAVPDAETANGASEEAKGETEAPETSQSTSEPLTAVASSETAETVEEKRGAKRKAKTPEGEDEGSASKKRSGDYILTHGKPNDSSASSRESNQNRFRIYFESPPELDRIPKALRRNPNKRWRREESGSVAPSVVETAREGTVGPTVEAVEEQVEDADVAETTVDEGEEDSKLEGETAVDLSKASGGAVEREAGSAGTGKQVESTEPTELARAGENTVSEAPATAASELHDSTLVVVENDATADIAAAAGADPADVSMATDPGAIESAINELVDEAAAEAALTESAIDDSAPADGADDDDAAAKVDGDESPQDPKVSATDVKGKGKEPQANGTPEAPLKPDAVSSPSKRSAEEIQALANSAENTASAYKTRTRRRSSVSSVDSTDYAPDSAKDPGPSLNRLSVLYEESSRRLCFDAAVVDKVKIYRKEGKIEVIFIKDLQASKESDDSPLALPRGILVETYDSTDQRFVSSTREKLEEVWTSGEENITVPSLHKAFSSDSTEPLVFTVYLNMKKPLSEPKWCRNNSADEWLVEQFGSRKATSATGWNGKLEIVDPDPAPTLQSILDSWVSSASYGTTQSRKAFTSSLLSDPNDLVEILLRLARGDRNPTASTTSTLGPLATAVRPDSPYASHQTHVSLAILAMYRLTTDYAAKAGEKSEVVNEKVNDIIKSLPQGMIHKSLEGLFREWGTGGKSGK